MIRRRVYLGRAALLLALASSAVPQAARGQTVNMPPSTQSQFDLSVGQVFDESGNELLAVSTSLPLRRLVFFRKENRYESTYRIYLELEDDKGRHIKGDVWEELVAVDTYDQTKSSTAVSRVRKLCPVGPGEYRVKVEIEVLDTSLRFRNEKSIRIVGAGGGRFELTQPGFWRSPPSSGDKPPAGMIVFVACPSEEGDLYVRDTDGDFSDFRSWLHVSYNLVGGGTEDGTGDLTVTARITDGEGGVVMYGRHRLEGSEGGHRRFCLDINIDDLRIGYYTLQVIVSRPEDDRRTESEGTFPVLFNRGMLGGHFVETLELLSVFVKKEELVGLAEAVPNERIEAWYRFWEGRRNEQSGGPRNLQEFFNRLRYIQKNYARYGPGWENDMGRIYLRYGHPERVEEHSGGRVGQTYQFWFYYSLNLLCVFEDSGSGRFYLVDTRML